MLATTYPLLSIAFARSQRRAGTMSGKSVRIPVFDRGPVSDATVTMARSSGTGSTSTVASSAMKQRATASSA
jgi:hypothetical protein